MFKRLSAYARIDDLSDENSFIEHNRNANLYNPLGFQDYEEKYMRACQASGMSEAIVTGVCKINGNKTAIAVMDANFMMGSMGAVVGEKVCELFEYAVENALPVVVVTASGGARMQEGVISLAQMANTVAAVEMHNRAGFLYISVLTDPTLGGVSASFASLADIIIAEPAITYGFTGKRIVEETVNQRVPADFQMSEACLKNGTLDMIVERESVKAVIALLLKMHR